MKNEQLSSADENYVGGVTKPLIYRQRRSCSQYGAQEIGGPDVNVSIYALNFYRANFLPRRWQQISGWVARAQKSKTWT